MATRSLFRDLRVRMIDWGRGRETLRWDWSRRPRLTKQSREGGSFAKKSHIMTTAQPVPQTNTGRRGENPKALERNPVKELGKLTP